MCIRDSTNGDIKNTQRIYAGKSLDISGKSFISTGNDVLLGEYADLMPVSYTHLRNR